VTDSKHVSEETVEDAEARVEAAAADTAAQALDKPEGADTVDEAATAEEVEAAKSGRHELPKVRRQTDWSRVIAFGLLPALAFLLALGAAFLKFQDSAVRDSAIAREQSVAVAKASTIALLSYEPDTVEQQLNDAKGRLAGDFRDQYTSLINDVVIPGAKEKKISAVANVAEAASVSANPGRAVVLVFVNQTVIVGDSAPTDTASSVRITLDKVGDQWLISQFDPV
jgi:Mce-associated membrane protein